MHKVLKLLPILIVLGTFSLTASASDVVKGNDGMYWASYDSPRADNLIYQVDTVTEKCFVIFRGGKGMGIAETSCKSLAKRPEWLPIITWAND